MKLLVLIIMDILVIFNLFDLSFSRFDKYSLVGNDSLQAVDELLYFSSRNTA